MKANIFKKSYSQFCKEYFRWKFSLVKKLSSDNVSYSEKLFYYLVFKNLTTILNEYRTFGIGFKKDLPLNFLDDELSKNKLIFYAKCHFGNLNPDIIKSISV